MNDSTNTSSKRRSLLKLIFGFSLTSPVLSCGGSGETASKSKEIFVLFNSNENKTYMGYKDLSWISSGNMPIQSNGFSLNETVVTSDNKEYILKNTTTNKYTLQSSSQNINISISKIQENIYSIESFIGSIQSQKLFCITGEDVYTFGTSSNDIVSNKNDLENIITLNSNQLQSYIENPDNIKPKSNSDIVKFQTVYPKAVLQIGRVVGEEIDSRNPDVKRVADEVKKNWIPIALMVTGLALTSYYVVPVIGIVKALSIFTGGLILVGGSAKGSELNLTNNFPFSFSAKGSAFTGVLACGYNGAEIETHRNFEYTGNGILNIGSNGTVSANFTVLSNFSAASENCPAFENSATQWTALGEVAGNSIVCITNNVGGTNFEFHFEKGAGGTVTVAFRDKDHNGTGQGPVTSQWK